MSPNGITSWKKKFRDLPGRREATDEVLLEEYKSGKFLNQIRSEYIVGLRRLRKIVREYEASKVRS